MATRLLRSPTRSLASPAPVSRSACARPPACGISGGQGPFFQPARTAQAQQAGAAAGRPQRLHPSAAVAQPQQHRQQDAATAAGASLLAPPHREAVLCQRFKAHTSALTAALVLTDTGDHQQIITASLDKSVALWSAQGTAQLPESSSDEGDCQNGALPSPAAAGSACLGGLHGALRLGVAGGPVFSLALDAEACGSGLRQVFLGTAAKQILAWEPPSEQLVGNVQLGGHTGWVRALAQHGRWLFSCSCNTVQQWDMSRAVPRHVRTVSSFTGDVLAACTGNATLFTAGANGALRSWAISKTGELTAAHSAPSAHGDRITAAAWHAGFLYTASADGCLKMWDGSLELVTCVRAAHGGGKLHALAVGPDGVIYTGGDDKLIRRWRAGVSAAGLLAEAAPPLFCHHAPVRTLAAGPRHTIVSGDSRGDVAIWRV